MIKVTASQIEVPVLPTIPTHIPRRQDVASLRAVVLGLNLNAAAPIDLPEINFPSGWINPIRAVVARPTADLHLAQLGIYSGAGGTGVTVASPQALTNLTTDDAIHVMTLAVLTKAIQRTKLYPRLTVAAGVAGTADLYVYYEVIEL